MNKPFSPMTDLQTLGLYLVMTDPVVGYVECARIAADEGVAIIQLRMKNTPHDEFLRTAESVRRVLERSDSLFIVNDDLDIAMAVDADGVHVGQNDLTVEAVRARWNVPGKIVGLSTHGGGQDQAAQSTTADYIGVGPIYPTPTKAIPDPVVGTEALRDIVRRSAKPCVAIGGINAETLRAVLSAGAKNYAVVRAVCASDNPRAAIQELKAIERERGVSPNRPD